MKYRLLLIGALGLTLTACGKKEETPRTMLEAPPTPIAKPAVGPGELKFATVCSGCHGKLAQGMGVFPKLSGRTAEYIKDKLARYRAGNKIGEMSDTMMPFAQPLTDEEINQIAAYIAGLK